MCLYLHVVVLVSLSDLRATSKTNERQSKTRHLLYLGSTIDVAPRLNQLLHRVRLPIEHHAQDRCFSILGERVSGVGLCGGGGEAVWWIL
jgi:hypothetical protein